jgi:HK97 family phage portal protein
MATLNNGGLPSYVQLSPNYFQSYETLYRTQPALRTVISFVARNLADLPLDVFERVGDNDRKKVPDHPLAKLLDEPFPGSKWTKYRLINWTFHERLIFDCAYWLKVFTPDGQKAIQPIPRRFIEPIGDNPLQPSGYRLTGTTGYRDLEPEAVVHFNGYAPDSFTTGVSPIETLRQILAEEFAATQYRAQMWRNGARVGGYISRPEKAPRWSPEARMRFTSGWQAQYTGDGLGAGGTPVLEDGMTYTPSGITPRDAQYAESRQLTREEVAIAYHVDPSMLGLQRSQASASVPELHKMLYSDSFGPWLEEFQQDIECQLLPDLEPAGRGKFYVEFNLRKKMQGSFEQQAAAISASVGGPWMTRSEGRALYNLPHLDDADELVVPMNVTAGGLASPRDTAPNNPSNEASNGKPPAPKPIGA